MMIDEIIQTPDELYTGMTTARKWELIRAHRNSLLAACDYAMHPDAPPYTQTEVDAIAGYRQALRDLPKSATNPDDIVFPESPL